MRTGSVAGMPEPSREAIEAAHGAVRGKVLTGWSELDEGLHAAYSVIRRDVLREAAEELRRMTLHWPQSDAALKRGADRIERLGETPDG